MLIKDRDQVICPLRQIWVSLHSDRLRYGAVLWEGVQFFCAQSRKERVAQTNKSKSYGRRRNGREGKERMGLNHSTPIPTAEEFNYQPQHHNLYRQRQYYQNRCRSKRISLHNLLPHKKKKPNRNNSNDDEFKEVNEEQIFVSLSDEMKSCTKPGEFYGITLHNDPITNQMLLKPMNTNSKLTNATPIVTNTTTTNSSSPNSTSKVLIPPPPPSPSPPSSPLPPPPFMMDDEDDDHDDVASFADNDNSSNNNVGGMNGGKHGHHDTGSSEYLVRNKHNDSDRSDDDDYINENDAAAAVAAAAAGGNPAATPQSAGWRVTGQMDVIGGRLYLRGSRNQLVAVVVRKFGGYLILGRTPMFPGQMPNRKYRVDDKYMYPWVTIRSVPKPTSFFVPFLSSTWMIQRHDIHDLQYIATSCGPLFGSRMLRISERSSGKPISLIKQYFVNDDIHNCKWDLLVGPGICPCLMVCFVGILNKSMGKST